MFIVQMYKKMKGKVTAAVHKIFRPIQLIIKELKLVEWLSPKKTAQFTVLVLAISFITGIIIVVLDIIFFTGRGIVLSL